MTPKKETPTPADTPQKTGASTRVSRPRKTPKKQPTFLGMALMPTPPSQRTKKAKPNHTQSSSLRPPRNQGLALLIVLTMLVLATTITIEMQFDARVQLQLAANSRNALQAEYLARSSLQFTHLLLAFNSQFMRMKSQFKTYLKAAPPQVQMILNRLQLWKVAPINSDILKKIASGAFGTSKDPKKEGENKPGEDQGKLYPFGEFRGRFSALLEDESSKININRFANYQDGQALLIQLKFLFAPKKYDPIFERTHKDGYSVTRQEQISAFADWVDRNENVVHEPSNTEDSKYRYADKGYKTKNTYLYSLDELRLIYGVDDVFFQTFGKMFTVYGRTLRVNINDADPAVLSALIMSHANLKPQEFARFFQPEFQKFIEQLVLYRSYLGFSNPQEFVNWVQKPVILDPRLYSAAAGSNTSSPGEIQGVKLKTDILQKIHTEADTFRIEASGQVGTVRRRISTIIYVHAGGKRETQYWRLH